MREQNHRPAPPGNVLVHDTGGTAPQRASAPAGADLAAGRPITRPPSPPRAATAAREPSWGRVLATTISLWTGRRLRRMGRIFFGQDRPGDQPDRKPAPRAIEAGRGTGARWRMATVALAVALVALATLVLTGTLGRTSGPASPSGRAAPGRPGPATGDDSSSLAAAAAARTGAAAWIARQVSGSAIVACDPIMCSALAAQGVTAGRLLDLQSTAADPLGADVVVATPAIRSRFGARLAGSYAPAVIASFGSGGTRVDIRAIAPDGAAAYESAVRSDLAVRAAAGAELLRNPHVRVTAPGARQLRAGDVDSRLLVTLATLASQHAFRVTTFSDAAPGARAPFQEVTLTSTGGGAASSLRAALRLVRSQHAPYLPSRATIVSLARGQAALRIEFGAPSPLGLLSGGA